MYFKNPTVAAAGVLAVVIGMASAQEVLPDSELPNIGGGYFNASDPAVASYQWNTVPPFAAGAFNGYYKWAVNNNTVSVNNATYLSEPFGITDLGQNNTKYPFYLVSEGTPKEITLNGSANPTNKFKKILYIIFENEVYNWTMSSPWWQLLATRGKLLTNSHGIAHPSLPNYAAIVAGDFFGVSAENFYFLNTTSIYDLLDAKGLDYASYVEWYTPVATDRGPNDCNNAVFLGPMDGLNKPDSSPIYRRLDIPALLFSTYVSNYTRCEKVLKASQHFASDVFSHNLPAYSFYVPDLLHNAHDPVSDESMAETPNSGGMWLSSFLDMYLDELTRQGTLVVATWDEATWASGSDSIPNNNNSIATLLFGQGITPNTTDDSYFTHYGLLRGAINNFGLGSLGRNDTNATNGDLSLLVSSVTGNATSTSKPAQATSAASGSSVPLLVVFVGALVAAMML
ncbi:hypothetical protein V1515DRAFT_612505 [Lipomyces mesembrius]